MLAAATARHFDLDSDERIDVVQEVELQAHDARPRGSGRRRNPGMSKPSSESVESSPSAAPRTSSGLRLCSRRGGGISRPSSKVTPCASSPCASQFGRVGPQWKKLAYRGAGHSASTN